MIPEKDPQYHQYNELVYLIYSVRDGMRKYFYHRLQKQELDITFEMMELLGVLFVKDGQNQQEIANTLKKNKASITPLIDNLMIRNLVIRQADTTDRRNKLIYLTAEGEGYRKEIYRMLADFYEKLKEQLGIQELTDAVVVLKKINQLISQ